MTEELSAEARSLIEAAKGDFAPGAADSLRNLEALRLRIADLATGTAAATQTGLVAGVSPWAAVGAGAFVLATLGGYFLSGESSQPARPTPAPTAAVRPSFSSVPVAQAPLAPVSSDSAASDAAVSAPVIPAPQPRAVGTVSTRSDAQPSRADRGLAAEVALLTSATSALHGGRSAEALRLLDDHAKKFPSGRLSLERRSARAQALCRLGRPEEARKELGRLPSSSPQAKLVRSVCGID